MPNWDYVLKEIKKEKDDPKSGESAADKVRTKYLKRLQKLTGRNIIGYYSGFLSKPRIHGVDLNDEDKNGFMLAAHKLDKNLGLDLFIHTPGGSIAATESLVDYIRQLFGTNVRAFVPQIAMSAGTMLACSCKEIFMGKHSNLGPVDPSVNGIQAQAVLAEINMAYQEMAKQQARAMVWHPILSRYTPSFVQLCQWAVERSEQFVENTLVENMLDELEDETARRNKARQITKALIDLSKNKGHDKHLHLAECEKIGLKIKRLEEDKELRDLVLTVHHCYMHTLANTPAFKIVENHLGRRMVKLAPPQMVMMNPPTMPAPPTGVAS